MSTGDGVADFVSGGWRDYPGTGGLGACAHEIAFYPQQPPIGIGSADPVYFIPSVAVGHGIASPAAETDPRNEPGRRLDAGKARYDLIPPEALEALAMVYTKGAEKYAPRQWEAGMSWGRCFAAMMRHAWKFWRGETYDDGPGGSGCHHMAHVMWNAAAILTYQARGKGTDDRSS